ncbi:MAG: hypothetical protein ACJ76S_07865 [Solirubrobacteraceae bacterium]|jgi:hypothetical protein
MVWFLLARGFAREPDQKAGLPVSVPRTERRLQASVPNLLRRVIQLRRRLPEPGAVEGQPLPVETRVEYLERRLGHLEAAVEGLQDSVHREAVRQDHVLRDLERRAQPGEMRRALSDDARRRGL